MKIKDYIRLGTISIKSRKKSTNNTARGISFGLILLIPVIFFTLAFKIGLSSQINKMETVATVTISSRSYADSGDMIKQTKDDNGNYWGIGLLDFASANEIGKSAQVEEKIYTELYELIFSKDSSYESCLYAYSLGGEPKPLKPAETGNMYNGGLKIKAIEMGLSGNKIFTKAEERDLKKADNRGVIIAGGGFSGARIGQKQVMLSERLLTANGITADEVIGKKLSVAASFSSNAKLYGNDLKVVDSTNATDDATHEALLMSEFEVVGVINKNYYNIGMNDHDGDIWLTTNAIYTDNNYSAIAPTLAVEEINSNKTIVAKYSSIENMSEQAAEKGVMLLAYGALDFSSGLNARMYSYGSELTQDSLLKHTPLTLKMQAEDYAAADKLIGAIAPIIKQVCPDTTATGLTSDITSALYSNFYMINMIGKYVMLVMYAFGGIVFFATMLNLYNTINYSVAIRKNYMGMMRAIGARQSVIPRLYFVEVLLIFLKAMPWVLAFSALISFIIKFGIDFLFKQIGGSIMGVTISLSLWYYALTLAVVVGVVFAIAWCFSAIATRKTALA